MYYDYDNGNLRLFSKFVNPLQAIFYKFNRYYKRKLSCKNCGNSFEFLVRKRQKMKCPECEV